MPHPETEPLGPVDPFASYRVPAGSHDEFASAGEPRPHWRRLASILRQWDPAELSERWEQARRLIRDNGVTYNIHEDAQGGQRPWVLDPIPLVIAADDWRGIEAGISQRLRVLDALLADLYGPQHLLKERVVPAELVLGHPAFLRCCHGIRLPGGRHLHLHASVLARHSDGRWHVLGDRTGVPHGLGYALENRLVVSRLLPAAFHESHVERLAPFFIGLRSMLRALDTGRDVPRIALFSPGPSSPTWFEDAYLARYLGLQLVEGGDLAVREDRACLKTLGGLVPIDVLLRRVFDRECDPLELDSGALAGTPGLVQAVRGGRVALANPLGSALVESPGFMGYIPAVARRLLGEELLLPSPQSWWCGRPDGLSHVLARLDDLVIEPVVSIPGGPKRYVPKLIDAAGREALVNRIRARPGDWVGREIVERSVAPCWDGGRVVAAPVVLRLFSAATPEGPIVMPGGLARLTLRGGGAGELAMDSGQGSKDVWVLSPGPVQPVSLLPPPGQPVPLRRSGTDLPSRVADHLHWLGRHVERAESAARLLRTVSARVASESTLESAAAVARLLATLAEPPVVRPEWQEPGRPETPTEIAAEVQSLVFDESRPTSVAASIRAMWQMASVVRDRISIDSWKILSRLRRDGLADVRAGAGGTPVVLVHDGDVLSFLDMLILDFSAFAGLGTESMTRGPGWRFLDMGRRLERATGMVHLLRSTIVTARADEQRIDEMLLEIADSSMTYRNRYLGTLQAAPLVDLLLTDETNPRSVGFQMAALEAHVGALPRDSGSPVLADDQRAAMAATGLLRLADVSALVVPDSDGARGQLDRLLVRLDSHLRDLSVAITHRYLVHAMPRRRLGDLMESSDASE